MIRRIAIPLFANLEKMPSPSIVKSILSFRCLVLIATTLIGNDSIALEVGIATRDVTPTEPVWLVGYSGRNRPWEEIDSPLVAQAVAFKDEAGERFVLVAVDNVGVSRSFSAPVLEHARVKHQMKPGSVMIVSSHTHSAPLLEGTLPGMFDLAQKDLESVKKYSRFLQSKLIEVIDAAMADLKPAQLEHAIGKATFAMNRRVFQEDKVVFGENPDGPVDWDVPVLKISGTNGDVRAILFGYACHGTSISENQWYIVSGDYMAYARQQLEAHFPGAIAVYLTGMGADSNPSPRKTVLDAKRHGLELAGAVVEVLGHPMRQVKGQLKLAYAEVDLRLETPTADQIQKDAKSADLHIRKRAELYLKQMEGGKPAPSALKLPISAVKIGNDFTFIAMGGEVVVDYGIKLKRLFGHERLWTIGYAYEVPCYIPSSRILREGGYEAEDSLKLYGLYGPFLPSIERTLVDKMKELMRAVESR